jgi:hypothetical protein
MYGLYSQVFPFLDCCKGDSAIEKKIEIEIVIVINFEILIEIDSEIDSKVEISSVISHLGNNIQFDIKLIAVQ